METRERCPVKRYGWVDETDGDGYRRQGIAPVDSGTWVKHSDYVALESRALAAEARIREAVEVLENDAGMPPVDAGVQPYMDWRYIQRRDALAILTRDPVLEPVRKPEVTP